MTSELQRIVDGVAVRLRRAAAIDDPRLRLQVHSPHHGPVDQTRLTSILEREAPADVRDWVLGLGIASAAGPFRLPDPPPDLGSEVLPRVGAPIRGDGMHLGFLWIIDHDRSMTEEDLAALQEAADAAGVVMHRERLVDELARTRQREALRALLTGDEVERADAASRAVEDGVLVEGPAAVVVVLPAPAAGRPVGDDARTALDRAIASAARGHERRRVAGLVRADHAALAISQAGPAALREVAERLRTAVLAAAPDLDRVVAGIGPQTTRIAELATSYADALEAARVARAVAGLGDVVTPEELGVYGVLAKLPAGSLTEDLLPPGLRALQAADDDDATLVTTLETYLDLAGDAQATAAALVIHRTSLYYRLRRIRELGGIDLASGEDRLAVHLGLKVARMLDQGR